MNNRILFYSSVKSKTLFETQKFYKIDIDILKNIGFNVYPTNRIADFFKFWYYDISFIYFYRYGVFPALISKIFGKRVFFTGGIDDLEESYATRRRYIIQRIFFKLCCLFSNKCIIVSVSDFENIKKIYKNRLPKKIVKSFHSIDVDKFICDDKSKGDDFTTIVWMGGKNNVQRKGVDTALVLFSILSKKYNEFSNSKFIIIGKEGDGTLYIKELIEKLNIENMVKFTGEIDESTKIDILKKSKYYFQLSKYEGFGLAAIEALASRNIVFHSNKGGLRDSVGRHGIIINIDEDLEAQIETIYQNIISVNDEFLSEAESYVKLNFSNERRIEDFKKIILERNVEK